MLITSQQAQETLANADLIYDWPQLDKALDKLAHDINADLRDAHPVVLCVMVGGLMPTVHLVSRFSFPLQLDYVHATRYRGNTSGGDLHWIARPQTSLKDRVVLLVDDILDEGHTLAAIVDDCLKHGAREVRTVVLLDKQHGREKAIEVDYKGLDVVNRYVFGFGMDYKEHLRNLPSVYAVKDDG